jgi:anti-anti-sigma regulatory factor
VEEAMLRITTSETDNRQKWILQGQLAGPWVAELQSSWDKVRESGLKSVVDLTDVTFVDEAGARVLCAMKRAGVKFIANGVDTKHLLEEATRKTEPALRRCLSWLSCGEPSRKDETEKQ